MKIETMSENKGFTLIELVMVIVIIGILAAAALPRFANLTSQARVASNKGIAGALRSAMMIAHAAWIAGGASGSTVALDGSTVSVNASGWPNAGVTIGSDPTTAECVTIVNAVLIGAPDLVASPATCTTSPCYVATSTVGAETCVYTSDGGDTISYTLDTGTISSS